MLRQIAKTLRATSQTLQILHLACQMLKFNSSKKNVAFFLEGFPAHVRPKPWQRSLSLQSCI